MDAVKPKRRTHKPRFYTEQPLPLHTALKIDGAAGHHLLNVLRVRTNDELILFNGDGCDYHGQIDDVQTRGSGKGVVVRLSDKQPADKESPLHITLVQCVSRHDRMDISLRQATELGVRAIQPIYSRHSAKTGDRSRMSKRQEHWRSIAISSCEQSGRAVVPVVHDALRLSEYVQGLTSTPEQHDSDSGPLFVLSPGGDSQPFASALRKIQGATRLSLLIGPESGLDDDEIAQVRSAGGYTATLGPRILRTETAGPVCIAIAQSTLGDFV